MNLDLNDDRQRFCSDLNIRSERQFCSKLQAHKSSFQAWKTVSFACSLLVLFLLVWKYHEISTDLRLIQGLKQLTVTQQQHLVEGNSSVTPNDVSISTSQLPQVVNLAEILAIGPQAILSSGFNDNITKLMTNQRGFSSTNNSVNDETLLRHIQIQFGRELNGNQLHQLEVELFSGEFKNSKSTLVLSSLLVGVYIVSWILMTLAINDERISNDISLRNILLLSVFGAIDIAASVAFVMVRLIMYSVKNDPFAKDLLSFSGLRDSPIKLSADQVTSFAALRLVFIHSSSASIDLYVSSLVSLLTILRLYAILRALTYYRRLRRLNEPDINRNLIRSLQNHRDSQQSLSLDQTQIKPPFGKMNENQNPVQTRDNSDFWLPLNSLQFGYYGQQSVNLNPHVRNLYGQGNGQLPNRVTNNHDPNIDSHQVDNEQSNLGEATMKRTRQQIANNKLILLKPQKSMSADAGQQDTTDQFVFISKQHQEAQSRSRHVNAGSEIYLLPASSGAARRQRAASSTASTKVKVPARDGCESEPTVATERLSRLERAHLEALSETSNSKSSLESEQQEAKIIIEPRRLAPVARGRRQQQQQQRLSSNNYQQKPSRQQRLSLQNLVVGSGVSNEKLEYFNTVRATSNGSEVKQPTVFTLMRANRGQQSECSVVDASKYKLVARYKQLGSLDSTATTARTTNDSSTSCGPDDSDGSDQQFRLTKTYMLASGMKQSEEFVTDPVIQEAHESNNVRVLSNQSKAQESATQIDSSNSMGRYYYCA